MYPEFIEIQGKEYKIDTDYRIALACFRAINDEEISDTERSIAIVTLLLGKDFPFELIGDAVDKCATYLRCGRENNQEESEIDMDYEQDKGYLMASFMSCYHIDINREKMHWWAYNDYIEGFKEDDVLSRVRYIRNLDLNEIKDSKERESIIKAKKQVELKRKKTLEEIEADKMWEKLLKGE